MPKLPKLSKKTSILYILLFVAFIVGTFLLLKYTKVIEGFSAEYKYLERLPANNTWSQSTQDAFQKKISKGKQITTADIQATKLMQQYASEEEALEYINTGMWPWDELLINHIKTIAPKATQEEINEVRTAWPNRRFYGYSVAPKIPQIAALAPLMDGNSEIITCREINKTLTPLYKKTNEPVEPAEYGTIIPKAIPNFKFTGEPYNVCPDAGLQASGILYPGAKYDYDITSSPPWPESFNIFAGKVKNSTPAPVTPTPVTPAPVTPTPSNTNSGIYNDFISLCKRAVPE